MTGSKGKGGAMKGAYDRPPTYRVCMRPPEDHHAEDTLRLNLKKVDGDRAKWVRHVYHVDWHDPSLYDIVVNVARIGIPTATEIVVDAAAEPQFRTPSDSKKVMDDLVLSADIQVRITEQGHLDYRGITVEADGGVVTIMGTVDTLHEADTIREVICNTPGVQEIKSKIKIQCSGVLVAV